MSMIEMYLLMNSGFGVDPEIRVFQEANNFISFRISKRFKGERHYRQFEVAVPAINKNATDEMNERLEAEVLMLQRYIDRLN